MLTEVAEKPLRQGFGVNVTKEERYGWNLDSHRCDEMRDVPLSMLHIDHANYQRNQSPPAIIAIASAWSWIACGSLIVARRPCGKLVVMEGAHRLQAARSRSDIKVLPCMIWDVATVEQEAAMFLVINEKRKAMRSIEKYTAGQTAKEPSCVAVAALLKKYDYLASSEDNERTCGCVGLLRKMITANPDRCDKLFALAVRIADGGRIIANVLKGLDALENALRRRKDEQSIFDAENAAKLIKIRMETLNFECTKAAQFYGKGGEASYAKGILKCINEGRKSRRIAELG